MPRWFSSHLIANAVVYVLRDSDSIHRIPYLNSTRGHVPKPQNAIIPTRNDRPRGTRIRQRHHPAAENNKKTYENVYKRMTTCPAIHIYKRFSKNKAQYADGSAELFAQWLSDRPTDRLTNGQEFQNRACRAFWLIVWVLCRMNCCTCHIIFKNMKSCIVYWAMWPMTIFFNLTMNLGPDIWLFYAVFGQPMT